MEGKKINIILIVCFLIILIFSYNKFFKKNKQIETNKSDSEDISYSSNIIKDVNYSSKDAKGNEYIVNALQGEIDYSNPDIVYLTNVSALVRLHNANIIRITSNYGKYNINNFDTIFSKNVLITYLDNKIKSEYLDFSIKRIILSKFFVSVSITEVLLSCLSSIGNKYLSERSDSSTFPT